MKKYLLYIVLFFITIQQFHTQENGVVALDLPVRNSLKFNRYAINPTFSFVREQNRYISFTNKREWVQFDDAPQTYLFSYSGRFKENMGIGLGLFQQNYGVLTTFGGVVNFAYNVVLDSDQNLTFGTNLGVYKSGINEGKVITNFPDPSLQNMPSNTIITLNPGINYGTEFFDFGISINNIVSYNFTNSKMIEKNPEQSVQGHVMYTGYMNSRGFFDESKFSTLIQSEFKKDKTIFSGLIMVTVPKGIWAQVGYNTLYGASGGLGLNITSQIALEYNYEKAIGNLSSFGNSHEITLAYKFKNRYRYNYSGDDDEQALFIQDKRPTVSARKPINKPKTTRDKKEADVVLNEGSADEQAKIEAENKAKEEAQAKATAEEQARIKRENLEKAEAEGQRLAEEAQTKAAAEEQARQQQEAAQAQLEAENKAKAEAEAIRLAEETKAREEAEKRIDTVQLDGVLVPIARDREALAMESLTKLTNNSKIEQQNLLNRLRDAVDIRQQDLDDLKEENDLSEQGIYKAPKPFKSVTAENAILESLKVEIDDVIKSQNDKITELERLYNERLKNVSDKEDDVNAYYLNAIESLKSEQLQALQTKENLLSTLETIKVATEFERKRRIKRAAYDNEEVRYAKDRAALNVIKQNTIVSSAPYEIEDFDFGEERNTNNIQIVNDVSNADSGYYLVLAVHSDVAKRDDFLTKAVASGKVNIDFFFDVKTSKYYIYYQKFDDVESASRALQSKSNNPLDSQMSMVKIEN